MKFNEYAFKDLLINIVDNRGKTCPTAESGTPLIATNCIKNDALYPVHEKVRFVDDNTYDNWFRGHPKPGDMIFVCKGSPGRVCWTPDPVNFCIAQDMLAIRADETKIHPKYLFALLRSKETQNKILNMHVGTLIPHFKKGDFGNLYFNIPEDMEYQKQVGEAYFEFCNKIELNHQKNQTLEEMAQAVFKSWFVDFDPTRAKIAAKENGQDPERAAMAAIAGKTIDQLETLPPEQLENLKSTAALFPETLTESELGKIPDAWKFRTFGDVSICLDSKRIPLSKKQREEKKPGNIPYHGATSVMDYINEWIFDDIYLLLGEDGSVIKEDGSPFVQYIWGKSWVNNHAHVLQGKAGISTEHLMIFIQSQNIAAYITGAVQLKLNQGNMRSIPFLDAGRDINNVFSCFIAPLYEAIRNSTEENRTLEKLRETLLPKLLSGEIDLSESA